MIDSKARQVILARRARFLAAAIAATGIVSSANGCCPQTCLKVDDSSPIPPEQQDGGGVPTVCLSVPLTPAKDAGPGTIDGGPATTPGATSGARG